MLYAFAYETLGIRLFGYISFRVAMDALTAFALALGVPFLLCVLPRRGILLAFVLTISIGHVGPTAFNGIVMAMALAFLRADDGLPIARWLRRGWPLLLLATLLLLLVSNHIYQTDVYPWHVFALFQLVLPALACVAALEAIDTMDTAVERTARKGGGRSSAGKHRGSPPTRFPTGGPCPLPSHRRAGQSGRCSLGRAHSENTKRDSA